MALKILLATEASGGGVGRHVLDLTKKFAECGHQVHLVYSINRAEEGFLDEIAALTIQFNRVTVSPISMRRSVGIQDIGAYCRLLSEIRTFGPFDVLHAHSSKAGGLVRLLPSSLRSKKIYTPHALKVMDPDIGRLEGLIYGSIESGLGRYASDAVIAVSPVEMQRFVALGVPSERIHLIVNGVDSSITNSSSLTRADLGMSEDLHIFGYVGRFSEQKAPERLVRSFLQIASKTRTGLIMVGDGPEREGLEAMVAKYGYSNRVYFAGQTQALPFYHLMDSFVLPSRFESMPYALLEASQFGLPILVTDVSGADLIVRDGYNGKILPNSNDPEPLTDALKLLLNSVVHSEMKLAAQKEVGRFSLESMAQATLQLYEKVCRGKEARDV